jgi:hypothetical protein
MLFYLVFIPFPGKRFLLVSKLHCPLIGENKIMFFGANNLVADEAVKVINLILELQ